MAIIWVVLLSGLVTVLALPNCYPQFKCHSNSTTSYEINGIIIECPEKSICNDNYISECKPCIVPEMRTCGFKCYDSNGGELSIKEKANIQKFKCTEGLVCNAYYDSCSPCIPKCKGAWKCNEKNLREVTLFGMTVPCPAGKICNMKNEDPCEPCIVKPFPVEKFPPQCDDTFSDTYPCRPGPKGDNYYYHCKKVSNNKYDYMVKLCKGLISDAECYNQLGLKVC